MSYDDQFYSHMQHLLQQFYSSTDPHSVPVQNWELQPLYTSSAGLNEQYYSDIIPNPIQTEPRQTTSYPEVNLNATTETLHTQNTDVSNTVPTALRISLYSETHPNTIETDTLHTHSDVILNNIPTAQPLNSEINPNITQTETLHAQDSDTTQNTTPMDTLQTLEVSANTLTQISVNENENLQAQLIYRGEKQAEDDIFNEDPCMVPHSCLPVNRYGDKANRHGYQACQALRKDIQAYKTTPYRHFSETAQNILNESWKTIDDRRKVLGKFHKDGFERRRGAFAKASKALKRIVEMSNVPEDLRHIPGGEVFMQIQTEDLHVYFSKQLIEMTRDSGLSALIGDGVHKLNPVTIPNRMDKGQLYVIHAAIQGGIELPILYAITRHKNLGTYKTIFESLREVLGGYSERIILDFEKAAIRAARETFPEATVQGCAFHLAQSWNRMAVNLGVRKFAKGPKAIPEVTKWWEVLKGVAFLPEVLFDRVTALLYPPYLKSVYFDGPFKGIWYKWNMEDFRTTNAAEAFHSKLRGMLSRRINPPFEELLQCLHNINSVAFGTLYNVKENAQASKVLRRRDQQRREKINQEMAEFKQLFTSSELLHTDVIIDYCRKMSRFVTEKTI